MAFIVAGLVGSLVLPLQADAEEAGNELLTTRSTSTDPANDDRVGALWETPGDDVGHPIKRCSTNYLGNGFWLTAHHCIARNPSLTGFILQDDGDKAFIEKVYTKSTSDDVALLKVGDGIRATPFLLPSRDAEVGEHLTLVGFANSNSFASYADVEVVEKVEQIDTGWFVYRNILRTVSLSESRSCDGDSGGGVFKGNTIYGIHTAGTSNPSCIHGKGSDLWHTALFPQVEWIRSVISHPASRPPEILSGTSKLTGSSVNK